VIIPGDGDQALEAHDIVLFIRGGGLKQINEMNPIYHSLHFVLLFPTGQLSWHPNLEFKAADHEDLPDERVENHSWHLEKKLLNLRLKRWWPEEQIRNVFLKWNTFAIDFFQDRMSLITFSVLAICFRSLLLMHGLPRNSLSFHGSSKIKIFFVQMCIRVWWMQLQVLILIWLSLDNASFFHHPSFSVHAI
jgi:hypothetical protein